jgi:hypothetical protein
MCLDELKEVCVKIDLFDENFVDRDINLSFNLAMMTQVPYDYNILDRRTRVRSHIPDELD